jgi:hypothetical protein
MAVMMYPSPRYLPPAAPYLVLIAFPIAVVAAVNPVRLLWGFHHGAEPMPADQSARVGKIDRYLSLLLHGILVALLLALMCRYSIPAARVGLTLRGWIWNVALGVIFGFLRIGLQDFVAKLLPGAIDGLSPNEEGSGPIPFWIAIFLTGAFAEEFWIAFSLIALQAAGHSTAMSLVIVGIIFGAVHFPYRLGVVPVGMFGILSGMLFLWRGCLIPSFLFPFLGNLGSLYWARRVGRQPTPRN